MLKKHFKHTAYCMALLLVLHSGLTAAMANMNVVLDADTNSQRILVCTSQGFKWILLSELEPIDANSVPSGLASTLDHCPFCTFNVYSIDQALTNSDITLELSPHCNRVSNNNLIDIDLTHHLLFSYHPSRAPPLV